MVEVLSLGQLVRVVPFRSLVEALAAVPDPRPRLRLRYRYDTLLALSFCAMLCGARSRYAIGRWVAECGPALATAAGLSGPAAPSDGIVQELFTDLDRDAFEAALARWVRDQGVPEAALVRVDPAALRGWGSRGVVLPGVRQAVAFARHVQAVRDRDGDGAAAAGAV